MKNNYHPFLRFVYRWIAEKIHRDTPTQYRMRSGIALAICGFLQPAGAAEVSSGRTTEEIRSTAAELATLRSYAEAGNVFVQRELGLIYSDGRQVPQDFAESIKWLRKAADHGDATAQFSLSLLYEQGKGVAVDSAEAVRWLKEAAKQGDAKAQNNLGWKFAKGIGVAANPTIAAQWFERSALQGNSNAQVSLGGAHFFGLGLPKNMEEGVRWWREAALKDNSTAELNLGYAYVSGSGVEKSTTEAAVWYRKAAENGEPEGAYALGTLLLKGDGVGQNFVQAVAWFQIAAAAGLKKAEDDAPIRLAPGTIKMVNEWKQRIQATIASKRSARAEQNTELSRITNAVTMVKEAKPIANQGPPQDADGPDRGISVDFRKAAQKLEKFYSELTSDSLRILGENSEPTKEFMLLAGGRNTMKWEEERIQGLKEVGAKDACLYYTRILAHNALSLAGARGTYVVLEGRTKSQNEVDVLNRRFTQLEELQDELRASSLGPLGQIEAYLQEAK